MCVCEGINEIMQVRLVRAKAQAVSRSMSQANGLLVLGTWVLAFRTVNAERGLLLGTQAPKPEGRRARIPN